MVGPGISSGWKERESAPMISRNPFDEGTTMAEWPEEALHRATFVATYVRNHLSCAALPSFHTRYRPTPWMAVHTVHPAYQLGLGPLDQLVDDSYRDPASYERIAAYSRPPSSERAGERCLEAIGGLPSQASEALFDLLFWTNPDENGLAPVDVVRRICERHEGRHPLEIPLMLSERERWEHVLDDILERLNVALAQLEGEALMCNRSGSNFYLFSPPAEEWVGRRKVHRYRDVSGAIPSTGYVHYNGNDATWMGTEPDEIFVQDDLLDLMAHVLARLPLDRCPDPDIRWAAESTFSDCVDVEQRVTLFRAWGDEWILAHEIGHLETFPLMKELEDQHRGRPGFWLFFRTLTELHAHRAEIAELMEAEDPKRAHAIYRVAARWPEGWLQAPKGPSDEGPDLDRFVHMALSRALLQGPGGLSWMDQEIERLIDRFLATDEEGFRSFLDTRSQGLLEECRHRVGAV